MWYSMIHNNNQLLKLYDSIPELINVRMDRLLILPEEKEIKIVFDMPRFFDYFPENQTNLEDNVAVIQLVFKNFDSLELVFDVPMFKGNIFITKNLEDKLVVNLEGGINCNFIAEYGEVEEIRTYLLQDDLL